MKKPPLVPMYCHPDARLFGRTKPQGFRVMPTWSWPDMLEAVTMHEQVLAIRTALPQIGAMKALALELGLARGGYMSFMRRLRGEQRLTVRDVGVAARRSPKSVPDGLTLHGSLTAAHRTYLAYFAAYRATGTAVSPVGAVTVSPADQGVTMSIITTATAEQEQEAAKWLERLTMETCDAAGLPRPKKVTITFVWETDIATVGLLGDHFGNEVHYIAQLNPRDFTPKPAPTLPQHLEVDRRPFGGDPSDWHLAELTCNQPRN